MQNEPLINQYEQQITKRARYFTLGDPNSPKWLYVLHGYGQLASFFIQKFEALAANGYFVIAPEGLHRFYLEGTSGRVGASWMTKEEREADIADNIDYLNALHADLQQKYHCKNLTVLGFSQGGATAARWIGQGKLDADQLLLWACVFPDDMKQQFLNPKKKVSKCVFVVGDEDPYFAGESRNQFVRYYEELNFSVILYRGTHQIEQQTLQTLFAL